MTFPPPRRLSDLPPGLPALREEAEADGLRLLCVLEEDWEAGAIRFAGPGEALFAVEIGPILAGIGGVTADPYAPAGVARVRRLYVARAFRRHGIGRALVTAARDTARDAGCRSLRVRAPDDATAFYERLGFRRTEERGASHALSLQA